MTQSTLDKKQAEMDRKRKRLEEKEKEKFTATAPGVKTHRIEFIESQSYVKGVRDEEGKMVIRPLNKEEREFLSNFNRVEEHANFSGEFLDLTEKQRSSINHKDYARKMDLMYMAKKDGKLISYDIHEADRVLAEAEKDIEWENLELEPAKKSVRLRRKREV